MNDMTVPIETASSTSFLVPHFQVHHFRRGERIFSQGDVPNGCYVVIEGEVSTHYFDTDIQAEADLQNYFEGEVIGAIGAIDRTQRAISATAKSDVALFHITAQDLQRMPMENQGLYFEFLGLANNTVARKFRALHDTVRANAVSDAKSPVVDATVERAVSAQKELATWENSRIQELISQIANAVNEQAQSLAEQTVQDTGMGVVAHKVQKILLGTVEVANSLNDMANESEVSLAAPGVEVMTMPMGVVFGMIPVTNPVETIVFKALSAIKARNAIIISSHRKARNVGDNTVEIIRDVLGKFGAPVDLVQSPELPANRKLTQAFMTHEKVNFILATGGPSMVKSAYRSGTPAIGVGKGNAPVWVTSDSDIKAAAKAAIRSKAFDNGVVCGSENNLLVDTDIADDFLNAAIKQGAVYLSADEKTRLLETAFVGNALIPELVGQSAEKICQRAGIERDYEIRLILAEEENGDFSSPFVREILAPILSFIRVYSTEDAIFHATTILGIEGQGHTAIVHSNNQEKIQRYANAVDVSRVLVNSPGTQGCIGACNGLQLSWTLGCGTQGGGSTSDNVTYRHLQNKKRIAYGQ